MCGCLGEPVNSHYTPASESQAQTAPSFAVQFDAGAAATIWASMLVASWGYKKAAGAIRLYVAARTLDTAGSSFVSSKALQELAMKLKVHPRTFAQWKADAIRLGIFVPLHDQMIRVVSQDKIFRILNVETIDKTKVVIPLKSLFGKGWRAHVWAAYLKANHNDRQISQKKLQEITGVSVSAQKNTLHKHYKSRKQIGITRHPADMVGAFNEYTSHGKAFVFTEKGNRKVTAIHLPSIKSVSDKTARIAGRGRRIAILARLARYGMGCIQQPLSNSLQPNKTIAHLFYSTPKQQKKASRILSAMSRLPQDPNSIFIKRARNAWDVCDLQSSFIF